MRLLGISGSLRRRSYNTALLHATAVLSPANMEFIVARPLDRLPYFNMDLDNEDLPIEVKEWRAEIAHADALLIFTPEYVHNISGVLKNALDWLVSSHEIINKPVAVISSSPNHLGAAKAHASLCHIIDVISGNLITNASFQFPAVNWMFDDAGRLTDKKTVQNLVSCMLELSRSV